MYIELPYACKFIAIDSIIESASGQSNIKIRMLTALLCTISTLIYNSLEYRYPF